MAAEKPYDYALTTLQRIKDRMGITVNDNDAVLLRLLNAATDYIENVCNRRFKQSTYTNEIYPLRSAQQEYLPLKQTPVTTLTSLQYRAGTPTNPVWTNFPPDYFELLEDGESGLVRMYGLIAPFFYSGSNAIRATYTAGYLIDFSNYGDPTKHNLPADLTDLCERMVVRWWKKRDHEGKQSESVQGSSITWKDVVDDIDNDVLNRYSRQAGFV